MRELSLCSVKTLASINKRAYYDEVKLKFKHYQNIIAVMLFSISFLAIVGHSIISLIA